jgi:uncharacterized C2H2 Zn-finger protein
MEMTIEIPADNDGFVLLQCALCGEIFKVKPCDFEDDTVHQYRCCNREVKIKPLLKIAGSYCPFCGVKEFETQ